MIAILKAVVALWALAALAAAPRPIQHAPEPGAEPPASPAVPEHEAAPALQPAEEQPPDPAAAPDRIETADDLLRALEQADRDLRTLSALLVYDKRMGLVGDRQTRVGTLYFSADPAADSGPTRRKFGVEFRRLIVDGAVRDDPRSLIFDGQWLVEKLPQERQFIKRQVVAPGERFDPLRLGEGPFPLPIGQKREDILARYEAELLPPEAGLDPAAEASAIEFTQGTYQLRLTPRPDRADEDAFEEIRLWYKPGAEGALLPHLARTVRKESGDVALVILKNVRVNEPLPEGVLDTEPPADGWVVSIREWDGQALE